MRFWCVSSSFDDRGRGSASIVDVIDADMKPEGSFRSTSRKDYYTDWFDSKEEAEEFVKEARTI